MPDNPDTSPDTISRYVESLGAESIARRLAKAREQTHGPSIEAQWKKGEEILCYVHSLQPFATNQSDRVTFTALDPETMKPGALETRLAPTTLSQDLKQRLAAGRRVFRIVYRGLMNGEHLGAKKPYHAFTTQAIG